MSLLSNLFHTNLKAQIYNPSINPQLGGGGSTPTPPNLIIAILLARLFSAALATGTVMLLIYLAYNSFRWLTAGGDSGQVNTARQGITQAIIGITLLASIFAIANLVAPVLGLSNGQCQFPAQICWPTF